MNKLIPSEIIKNVIKDDYTYRFPRINLGRFSLSVQGSNSHYCCPKEDNLSLDFYTCYEVAIFEILKGQATWVRPYNDPRFKDFKWCSLFENGGNDQVYNPVAGFVDKKDVEQIIEDLKTLALKYMD